MHSTDDLNDGYMGSGKRLWFSMNYHGRRNHSIEILEYYDTRIELRDREADLVNEDLLKEDLCMNLKTGGDGGFCDEEHRNKFIAAAKKTRHLGREKLNWLHVNDKDWVQKNNTKIKEGLKKINYDHKTFEGRSHTEKTKEKMGESMKGKGVGKSNSQYGTCWITRDGLNKKIKKGDLNDYLDMGWVKGRK
tara:strand:- start:13769 stop:14341 length:573 start_codon:yes stop_codon:yes gene_type:complete